MNIKKCFILLLFILMLPINIVFAKDSGVSSYYYVFDSQSQFTRTEIDEFTSIGDMLSTGQVDLVFNISDQNSGSGNEECKKIFYNYLKNIDYSNTKKEKKVIVMSYYTKDGSLVVYDDYGIITDDFMTNLNSKLKKYKAINQTNEGLLVTYEYMAQYLNSNLHLGVKSVSEIQIKDVFVDKSFLSFNNIFLVGIVIVILLCSRRNKKNEL